MATVSTRRKVLKRLGIVALALVMALVGTITYMVLSLSGRFGGANVDGMVGPDRPTETASTSSVKSAHDPFGGRAMNILVMGSDTRAGDNAGQVGDTIYGARSDSVFILHVSADRTRVDVVAIPRDTMVVIPQCYYDDLKTKIPGTGVSQLQRFNSALNYGSDMSNGKPGTQNAGVACVIKTVESISKVRMNGYILIDFLGFSKIVDAIDGVDLFLPCAVKSQDAGNLALPAGANHMDGQTALNYARARKGTGLGDNSDLSRIKRQQALLTALAKKVLGMDMLTNMPQLYNFVGSVGDAMSTDLGNGIDLAGFAYSLHNLSLGSLTFSTVPVQGNPDDIANTVIISTSRAKPVFDALSHDLPIPGTHPDSAQPTGPPESPVTSATAAPPTSASTSPTTAGTSPTTTSPTSAGTSPTTTSPTGTSVTPPFSGAPSTTQSTPTSPKSTKLTPPPGMVSAPLGQC